MFSFKNKFISRVTLLVVIIFSAGITAFGQNCACPTYTSNLVINTGYDPATGNAIVPGVPTGAPAFDPYWMLTNLSPACIPPTGAATSGSAFVVPGRTGWFNPLSPAVSARWINFFNNNIYNTTAGSTYTAYYTRKFYLCHEENVTITMRTAFDNGIKITLDASTAPYVLYNAPLPTSPAGSYAALQAVTPYTVHLLAGWHTIDVEQYNDGTISGGNGQAFIILGNISAPSSSLSNIADVPPVASIVSMFPICGGQSTCIGITGTPGATVTYAGMFGVAPGSVVLDASGNACIPVYIPNVSAPVTYPLTLTGITSPSGCHGSVTGSSLTVNPTPDFTINGPTTTLCSGDLYVLSPVYSPTYTASGGDTYSWSTGATTPSITDGHTTSWVISYSYSLTITSMWGCSSTRSYVVNVDPLPVAGVVTCPPNFCANDPNSHSCYVMGNNLVGTWSIIGGGTDVFVDGLGHITVNPLLLVPTTVTVMYTVTNSCGTDEAGCTFTVYPSPSVTITALSDVCSGDVYTVSAGVSPAGSYTYLWNTGSTSSSFVDMGTTDVGISKIYQVIVGNSWGCKDSASTFVNIHPTPKPVLRCGKFVCQGFDQMVVGSPGYSGSAVVTWTTTPGTGSISLSSPSTGSVIVHGLTPGTATLIYTVTDPVTHCSGSVTCIIVINATPDPITGITTVCEGSTTALSSTSPGGIWTSGNPAVATVDASGVVTGVSGGTAVISYSFAYGNDLCPALVTVTVLPKPSACVHRGNDGTSNLFFMFTASIAGVPISSGAIITFEARDCSGAVVPIGGLGTITGPLPYRIDWWLFPGGGTGICQICVTSITYMGCTWPVTDCCIDWKWSARPGEEHGPIKPEAFANVSIVPNPNTGVFEVAGALAGMEDSKIVNLEVVDMVGKTIFTEEAAIENDKIDKKIIIGENVANGIYFIKINAGKQSKTLRFVLDR